MRFKYKLGLALLAAGMIPIGVVSKLNLDDLEAFSRAEAIRTAESSLVQKGKFVSSYFDSMIDFGEVITARDELPTEIRTLIKNAGYLFKRDVETVPSEALKARYKHQADNTKSATPQAAAEWQKNLDPQTIALQELYIAQNTHPIGQKQLLDNANDGSSYSRLHAKIHPMYRQYLENYGFYDIFPDRAGTGTYRLFGVQRG